MDIFIEKLSLFFKGLGQKIVDWFVNLGKKIKAFFLGLPDFFVNLGKKIANGAKNYVNNFREGDLGVKFSYLFMGAGAFAHGQIIKGIGYLAIELLFIFYMIFNGAGALAGLFTLGTEFTYTYYNVDGGSGMEVNVAGDNSMLCLLYGVVALIVIVAFLIVYFMNIRSAVANHQDSIIGKKPNSFKQDFLNLFDKKFYAVLLGAAMVGVIAFTILPLVFMILIAFTNYDSAHPETSGFSWTGFETFGQLIGTTGLSSTFFPVLGWTLLWALCATFLNYFLGVGLALLINNKNVKGKKVWRTFFVLTIAIPQFVSLLLMRSMLGQYGPIMNMLVEMGLPRTDWFQSTNAARLIVILVNLWIGIPYSMLITSGILMNIPKDLYESARIDGAGSLKMFQKITLPYIMFVTGPYLITQFIGNINNFNVIFLLTGGAPFGTLPDGSAGSTSLLVTWLYKLTTETADYNLASAIGILTFLVCSIVSLITYKNTSSMKNEEDFQ